MGRSRGNSPGPKKLKKGGCNGVQWAPNWAKALGDCNIVVFMTVCMYRYIHTRALYYSTSRFVYPGEIWKKTYPTFYNVPGIKSATDRGCVSARVLSYRWTALMYVLTG